MDCVSEASLILEKQKNIEKLNEVNKLANKMMEQRNYNNMKDVKVSKSISKCKTVNDVSYKKGGDKEKQKVDSLHFVTSYLHETDKLIEQTKDLKNLIVKSTYQVVDSIQELKKENQVSSNVFSTDENKLNENEAKSFKNQESHSSIYHKSDKNLSPCSKDSSNFTTFSTNISHQSSFNFEAAEVDDKINNTIGISEKSIMSKLENLNSEFNSLCKNSIQADMLELAKPIKSSTISPRINKTSLSDVLNNNNNVSNSISILSSITDIKVPQLDLSELIKSKESFTDTKSSQNDKSDETMKNRLNDTNYKNNDLNFKKESTSERNTKLYMVNEKDKNKLSTKEKKLYKVLNKANVPDYNCNFRENFKLSHKKCTLDTIPNEMWLLIFSFLSFENLFAIRLVCSKFYNLANDSSLWRQIKLTDKKLTNSSLKLYSSNSPRHLEFNKCSSKLLTNLDMRNFFQSLKKSLVSLSVISCSGKAFLGDNISLHVSTHCLNIRKINIPWSCITSDGFSALVESLNCIEEIDISGNSLIDDSSFLKFVEKHSTKLVSIQMEGCFNISPFLIFKMVDTSPKLKVLNIALCNRIDNQTCNKICSALPSIRRLDLHGVKSFDDTSLKLLSENSNSLHTLIIGNCSEITDKGAMYLSRFSFRHLDISNCFKITNQPLLSHNFSQLEIIDTSSLAVSDAFIKHLSYSAPRLHTIKVSYCCHITNDAFVKFVLSAKNLKHVWAYGCKQINFSLLKEVNPSLSLKL